MSKRMSPNIRRMSAWSTMVTHSYVEKLVLPHEQLHPAIVELLNMYFDFEMCGVFFCLKLMIRLFALQCSKERYGFRI